MKRNFQGWPRKNNVEFTGFFVFGLWISKAYNTILRNIQELSFVLSGISRAKVKKWKIPGGSKKYILNPPVWIFTGGIARCWAHLFQCCEIQGGLADRCEIDINISNLTDGVKHCIGRRTTFFSNLYSVEEKTLLFLRFFTKVTWGWYPSTNLLLVQNFKRHLSFLSVVLWCYWNYLFFLVLFTFVLSVYILIISKYL